MPEPGIGTHQATAGYHTGVLLEKFTDHLDMSLVHLDWCFLKFCWQVWKGFGGKAWLYGEECLQCLRNLMKESLGVSLPDSMSDRAIDDVYMSSMSQAPYAYHCCFLVFDRLK